MFHIEYLIISYTYHKEVTDSYITADTQWVGHFSNSIVFIKVYNAN